MIRSKIVLEMIFSSFLAATIIDTTVDPAGPSGFTKSVNRLHPLIKEQTISTYTKVST
jgi:hypothetical protein